MFRTLRRQLLFSYTAVITLLLLIIGGLLFLLVASDSRNRIQPQLQDLAQLNRQTLTDLRELRNNQNDLDEIRAELRDIDDDTNARLLIVGIDDKILIDSRRQNAQGTLNYELLEFPEGQSGPNPPEFVRIWDENNVRYLGVMQTFRRGQNGNSWRLVHAIPETTATEAFTNFLLVPLLIVSCFGFALAGFFAWLISRSVARPLQAAAEAAHGIADGDYEQQLKPQGPREVRMLLESFNTMAAQVKDTNQAQKDFVANVSHDLKTPLTSIQGWSQAILDGAAETPQARQRAAHIINDESERMTRMVNQLLTLAKLEAGRIEIEKRPLLLAEVVRNVRRSLLFQAQEKEISLESDIQFDTAVILGNQDQITQMLINLAQNAINHTPEGGRVLLRLKHGEDGEARLSVRDTGVGIPAEDLQRVFERFYQVDKARAGQKRGTGLGLSIVRYITESHDGRISARSEEGKGSEFIATFPVHK